MLTNGWKFFTTYWPHRDASSPTGYRTTRYFDAYSPKGEWTASFFELADLIRFSNFGNVGL
jgi:hypothetical protein